MSREVMIIVMAAYDRWPNDVPVHLLTDDEIDRRHTESLDELTHIAQQLVDQRDSHITRVAISVAQEQRVIRSAGRPEPRSGRNVHMSNDVQTDLGREWDITYRRSHVHVIELQRGASIGMALSRFRQQERSDRDEHHHFRTRIKRWLLS